MKTVSRAEAILTGQRFYLTGTPCKRGHVSVRRVSNCNCVECESDQNAKKAEYKAKWYTENAEITKQRARESYERNRTARLAYASTYQKANIRSVVDRRKKRAEQDHVYALKERIRGLIRGCMKRAGTEKTSRTAEILGCSTERFKAHIERQFDHGMSWENFGLWHLDHIVPISSASTYDDVIALNHFTNFMPLWAKENLKKHANRVYLI